MESFEIQLENVTFTYEDGVQALRELSFRAAPGEFVVVLGANGAGKSTLCFLLSGIVPHIYGGERRGEVAVSGHDPWDEPIFETARYCGVLLQDPEVQLFNPTVFTELTFGPANLQVERELILQRIESTLALLHLDGLEKRNPRDLSGGQKQRVALGSVLTMQPRVLVLDEPTSQLDPVGRSEVVEAIHRLKSTGEVTIVMTTHETDDILDLADQVLVLEKGRVVLAGTPSEVFSQPERIRDAGVKIPDALDIWMRVNRLVDRPVHLSGEQIASLDAAYVGGRIEELLRQGRIRIVETKGLDAQTLGVEKQAPMASKNERQPVLEAQDLTYAYPGYPPVVALKEIDLCIRAGEIVGIVGQNGSGKSTLVKSFVGLLPPTEGRVLVNGRDIRGRPVGEMAREVGLVLQNPDYQLFTASSREEILFGLQNIGIEGKQAEERVDDVLRWVGLEGEIETFPFRLSFGDRRKLAVAATIALGPEILILDEPTTAQDHRGRYQLAEIGRRLRDEEGHTILMITHDMDLIARYADRLIVMWDGQVILDGPTGEVFAQEDALRRTFLRAPVAAQVARRLQGAGSPRGIVTVEEMMEILGKEG